MIEKPWRLANNGSAIVCGEGDEREIVTACPSAALFLQTESGKWIDRAEHIVKLHNDWLAIGEQSAFSRRYVCPHCGHKARSNNKRRDAVKTCARCRGEFPARANGAGGGVLSEDGKNNEQDAKS